MDFGISTEHHWTVKQISISICWGLLLFFSSLVINYLAGTYASNSTSNTVSDIILDHLPMVNVDFIFVDGILLFALFILILMIMRPRRAPFILKSLAVFIVVRSFFIIMTHMAPWPKSSDFIGLSAIDRFAFTGDLFFSAHTGLPYLMALTFWQNKRLRYLFLSLSALFGFTVLLGHVHYSIDVFGAFFITYGVFHIAIKLFNKDYHLLKSAR